MGERHPLHTESRVKIPDQIAVDVDRVHRIDRIEFVGGREEDRLTQNVGGPPVDIGAARFHLVESRQHRGDHLVVSPSICVIVFHLLLDGRDLRRGIGPIEKCLCIGDERSGIDSFDECIVVYSIKERSVEFDGDFVFLLFREGIELGIRQRLEGIFVIGEFVGKHGNAVEYRSGGYLIECILVGEFDVSLTQIDIFGVGLFEVGSRFGEGDGRKFERRHIFGHFFDRLFQLRFVFRNLQDPLLFESVDHLFVDPDAVFRIPVGIQRLQECRHFHIALDDDGSVCKLRRLQCTQLQISKGEGTLFAHFETEFPVSFGLTPLAAAYIFDSLDGRIDQIGCPYLRRRRRCSGGGRSSASAATDHKNSRGDKYQMTRGYTQLTHFSSFP